MRKLFELLKLADKGEYWSFCDQDDIWLPEKVRLAVEWLEQQKQTEPLLYYSLSEMMDDSGNSLGLQKASKWKPMFPEGADRNFWGGLFHGDK